MIAKKLSWVLPCQLINKLHSHQEAPYEPNRPRRAQPISADGCRVGHRRSFQVSLGPFHTCISEPLDRPRALASSVVKPLFSVLLTVANRKWTRKKWIRLCQLEKLLEDYLRQCRLMDPAATHVISGWRESVSSLEAASAGWGPEWRSGRSAP